MSTSSESDASTAINRRITRLEIELEQRETFAGYARLYAAVAVAGLFLTFLPILEDVRDRSDGVTSVTRFGTLWEMADDQGGDPAVLGIFLALCLVALSVYAVFRPRVMGAPIGVAVVSALIVLMLIVKPGTGEPVPDLTAEGNAGLALAIGAGCLGTIHAIHISRRDR